MDAEKRAVLVLVKSSTNLISRFITPNGDVVVVARVGRAAEAKTIAEVLARKDCAAEDGNHDYAACLYGWYEEHQQS